MPKLKLRITRYLRKTIKLTISSLIPANKLVTVSVGIYNNSATLEKLKLTNFSSSNG